MQIRIYQRMAQKMLFVLLEVFYPLYVRYIAFPWITGRFYAAWGEYQRNSHYSIRVTTLGFEYAFRMFFESTFEQKYLLERRLEKEPDLWRRLYFAPWTIEMPAVLETAAREGFFKKG